MNEFGIVSDSFLLALRKYVHCCANGYISAIKDNGMRPALFIHTSILPYASIALYANASCSLTFVTSVNHKCWYYETAIEAGTEKIHFKEQSEELPCE